MTDEPLLPEGVLPSWDDFQRDYVESGVHQYFVVRQDPALRLFVDQGGARIGLLVELPAGTVVPPSPLEQVDIDEVKVDGLQMLQAATAARPLFNNFYVLIQEIIATIWEGKHPLEALKSSIDRWRDLLAAPSVLSEERQAGLFGELWLLRRFRQTLGPAALDAWTGPAGQAHDFRVGDREFEVKTTSSASRIHTINGAGQLVPSPDCELFLLSLQLADAGASGGASLPELVSEIHGQLESHPGASAQFESLLSNSGYVASDAARYGKRRRLRSLPALIAVVAGVPRITPEALTSLAADFATSRIRRITYEIDVSDLGHLDGQPEFLAVVPSQPQFGADR